ncbi:MAG: hypothetical protein ACRYFS_07420 [Janthinobacterium lividum]
MRVTLTIAGVIIGFNVGGFAGLLSLFALSHVFTIGGGLQTTFYWAMVGTVFGTLAGGFSAWHFSRPSLTNHVPQKSQLSVAGVQSQNVWPPKPSEPRPDLSVDMEAKTDVLLPND